MGLQWEEGAKRGLKSAPFYMVREALFLLDPIEIGFEKAWVINLLVRFIRFVQKHVENKTPWIF